MSRLKISIALLFAATSLFAQTPQQLSEYVAVPAGWERGEKIETFNSETLYERINGAADAYLSCKFEEMTTFDLLNQQDPKVYINISMYRHATPADAFCIYAGERSPDMEFVHIGAEGYITGSSLYFVAGSVYVKIRSHSSDATVLGLIKRIATDLAKRIDPDAKLPTMLGALPKTNQVKRSDIYISESFMGHSFLHSAYQATYEAGSEYTTFIIDAATKEGAMDMLASYLKLAKSKKKAAEGRFVISDPYNGEIAVLVKGQYIIGICLENKPTINTDEILAEIAGKI